MLSKTNNSNSNIETFCCIQVTTMYLYKKYLKCNVTFSLNNCVKKVPTPLGNSYRLHTQITEGDIDARIVVGIPIHITL